jgi:hypothetical protein
MPNKIVNIVVLLIVLIILGILSFRLYQFKEIVPFHEDEHVYINRAIFFDLYYKKDFDSFLWHSFESDYSKLPDLIYGATLVSHKKMSVQSYMSLVDFNTDANGRNSWNVRYSQEYKPMSELPDEIYKRIEPVRMARSASLFFSIGSLICIFLIWWVLNDWLAGLVALLLAGFHPLFVYVTLNVMGDGPLVFFSILTFLFSLLYIRALLKKEYTLGLASVIGLSLGLAISSKLNGLFSLIYILGLLIFLALQKNQKKQVVNIGLGLLFVILICFNTILLTTPQIWEKPISGFLEMIQTRSAIIEAQQRMFASDALHTLPERLVAVSQWVFSWHDGYGKFPPKWENVTVFLIGIFALVSKVTKKSVDNEIKHYQQLLKSFLAWVVIIGGMTTALLPLNWNRYYLPIVLVVIMTQAFGISFLIKGVSKFSYQWWLNKKVTKP